MKLGGLSGGGSKEMRLSNTWRYFWERFEQIGGLRRWLSTQCEGTVIPTTPFHVQRG